MRDYINIGPTPPEEDCAQVGSPNYHERAKPECRAYLRQLRRHFGNEPEGALLSIKAFMHDFGSYHEVVCYFDTESEEAQKYAFDCESDGPSNWDALALEELQIGNPKV